MYKAQKANWGRWRARPSDAELTRLSILSEYVERGLDAFPEDSADKERLEVSKKVLEGTEFYFSSQLDLTREMARRQYIRLMMESVEKYG